MDSKRDIVTNIVDEVDNCPTNNEIRRAIVETVAMMVGTSICHSTLTQEELDTSQALYQTRYTQESWNIGTPNHE
jgi:lipoate-protein ligase A